MIRTPAQAGETESQILALLQGGAKTPIDIKKSLNLSREHTARMMKLLYEKGLVTRDDSAKPFVYQLTERGRSLLG
jgi:predicted transcriptional regulator